MSDFILSKERFKRIRAVADGGPLHPDDRAVLGRILDALNAEMSDRMAYTIVRVFDLPAIGSMIRYDEEIFEDGPVRERRGKVVAYASETMIEVELDDEHGRGKKHKLPHWLLRPAQEPVQKAQP